jgi:hypothetical protein
LGETSTLTCITPFRILIAEGRLEENSEPHRVARIVIHDGYDSLTLAQRALYDAVVALALRKRTKEIEDKKSAAA